MAQVINTNVSSINAQRNLNKSQSSLATAMQRLSSGLRINSAKDDAAGLAISERMSSQVRGLNQAIRNTNDGISLAQTAEGAMAEQQNIVQRLRELAVQSANASNSSSDRAAMQLEVNQLTSELDRIATTTEFNGTRLLDGSFATQQFQVGANSNQVINVSVSGSRGTQIGASVNASGLASTSVAEGGDPGAGGTRQMNDSATAFNAGATRTVTGAVSTSSMSDITINTVAIDNSSAHTGVATGQGQASAYAKAAAINAASSSTGVTAVASNSIQFGDTGGTAGVDDFLNIAVSTNFAAAGSYNLAINGTSVLTVSFANAAAVSTADTSMQTAVDAINSVSTTTGVSASLNAGDLVLTAADGRDIAITETVAMDGDTDATTLTTAFGQFTQTLAATAISGAGVTDTYRGKIQLQSTSAVAIGGTQADIGYAGQAAIAASGSVAAVNISTVSGANSAILTLDSALQSLNNNRASLGALQSRFESTIANLSVASENLSAARSRIRDADFAMETAELTRTQILQQAGVAMVSQANALPQSVLSLLQ